ncbi:MAG: 30S ribosome-binding factor RbfA [bacterium]
MQKRSYNRSDRVEKLIHQEISNILQKEINDSRLQFVTIIETKVSKDLHYADVFVNSYQGDINKYIKILNKAIPFIRQKLASKIKLVCTPEIRFKVDQTIEYNAHIFSLLKKDREKNNEPNPEN